MLVKPGTQTKTVSALSDNVFDGVLDISDLRSASIQVSGTFSLTLLVEVSNDLGENPDTWDTIATITAAGMYDLPLAYRSLRLRCSSYSSGSANISAIFSKEQPIEKHPATEAKQDAMIAEIAQKTEPSDIQNVDILFALRNLMQVMANPGYLNKSSNALWVVPNGGTVGTVTTVTGLTNIDSYQGKLLVLNQNNSAWASVVRSRIS
jgi:hypothetical protein